jgi:hypothetical protein
MNFSDEETISILSSGHFVEKNIEYFLGIKLCLSQVQYIGTLELSLFVYF